jgi:predicted nucleotidyltransferase
VEQILLFGFYAYGKPHKDSDLDLVDIVVHKQSKYNERKAEPTIERKIAREGILIYG